MPHPNSRHRKVAVLTPQGFQRLQSAVAQLPYWNVITQTCSLEALSEQTGLSPQTLSKVHARQANVDLRTLVRYFNALNLDLDPSDYIAPPQLDKREPVPASPSNSSPAIPLPIFNPVVSWGMAPRISVFYGCSTELSTLNNWVLQQHCRLVALVGMGGIGKTWLATRLAEQLQDKFQAVIWRSLKPLSRSSHSPSSFSDFIIDLIQHLAPTSKRPIPEITHDKIQYLLDCLHQTRCLLILDNVESVLTGAHTSASRENNGASPSQEEDWTLLFHSLSQGRHQSCVVLTSREEPKSIQRISGSNLSIRVLPLQGLQLAEAQQIFAARRLSQGSPTDWSQLVTYYGGNPLFLETVATTVQYLFSGNLTAFINQKVLIFDEIQELLDQQLGCLSNLEQLIIKAIAEQNNPMKFAELRSHIPDKISTATLLAAVQLLTARSLFERAPECFSLPQFLRDYIKERYPAELSIG